MGAKTWNGSTADWFTNDGADWSPSGVPDADDAVVIGSGQVSVQGGDSAISVTSISVTAGLFAIENSAQSAAPSVSVDDALTISGTGSVSLNGSVNGGEGDESFVVGSLDNSGTAPVGLQIGSASLTGTSLLQVHDGATNSGTIVIQGGATASSIADLEVDGYLVNSGTIVVGESGSSALSLFNANEVTETGGVIEGVGEISSYINNTGGAISGGVSGGALGDLTIDGDYAQSASGEVQADVDATGSSLVTVTGGDAYLDGGVLLIDAEAALTFGQLYTVMTCSPDSFEGFFGVIETTGKLGVALGSSTGFTLSNGKALEVFYDFNAGTIEIEETAAPVATTFVWTAKTGTWNASSGADWNSSVHASAPNAISNVTIGSGGGGTVTLGADQTVYSLQVTSGYAFSTGDYSIAVGGALAVASGASAMLGDSDLGALTVAKKGTVTVEGTLVSIGALTVAAGGALTLEGGALVDDTLSGAGSFSTSASSGGLLNGVTISKGTLFTDSAGAGTNLQRGVHGEGEILVQGGAGVTSYLNVLDEVFLSGGGTVVLENNGGTAAIEGDDLFNNDDAIEGAGTLGLGLISFVNSGTVDANVSGQDLTISTGGITDNYGLMEATNGGALVLDAPYAGTGKIEIGAQSEVQLDVLTAATLTFAGAGAKLRLEGAGIGYYGTISGFALGDIFELAGFDAISAVATTYNGTYTELVVENSVDTKYFFDLAGNLTGYAFSITSANAGADSDIQMEAQPAPKISAPKTAVDEAGQTIAIGNVSMLQTNFGPDEEFTVTIKDATGELSTTIFQGDITGEGTNDLILYGTEAQIAADLMTLRYTGEAAGTDTIKYVVVNGVGEKSTTTTTVATNAGKPKLTTPLGEALVIGVTAKLPGISINELGATPSETFSITLQSSLSMLSTTGTKGAITGNNSTDLTIKGTLAQVEADLALLTIKDTDPGNDTIGVTMDDSLGGTASANIATYSSSASVSVANFKANKSTLDALQYGFAIVDTSANILANLGAINGDSRVGAVLSTSGPLIFDVAELNADANVAGITLGGVEIADTAALLEAGLSKLVADFYDINSIVSSGAFVVDVSDALSDARTLAKVKGGYEVEDSAANIEAKISQLDDDAVSIASVVASGVAAVTVDDVTLRRDDAILAKIAGGFVLSDASATILAEVADILPMLSHISAIEFTDASPTLKLSVAQDATDALVLKAITSNYILEVEDGSLVTTTGHGAGLTIDDVPEDNFITGKGLGDIFVFDANFGTAVITDAAKWWTGSGHETIDLASSEFANFAALEADASFKSGVTTITNGADKLVLDGIGSLAALKAANALGVFQFK